MVSLRRLGALLSGLVLYCVVMLLVSSLASMPSPIALFRQLGVHAALPQELGAAILLALPVLALALPWSYFTVRPLRRGRRPTTAWCATGLLLAWLGWLIYGLIHASQSSRLSELPLRTLLLSSEVPPLWGLLNGLAALIGVILGGRIAARIAAGPNRLST